MGDITVAGRSIKACTREVVCIKVTRDLTGDINIYGHVVAGKEDGPTLMLLSMLHGEEWFSAVIFKELLNRIDPLKLKGNVIAIPVSNPTAFLTGSRCVLDNSDEPDGNRSFGSKFQWITSQMTNALEENFIKISDYLVDYHIGSWGSTMADAMFCEGYSDSKLTEVSKYMALAFCNPVLHVMSVADGPRTSMGFSGLKYGIPGIVAELGGLGFGMKQERQWLEENVAGTLNIMKYLKMIEGEPKFLDKYFMTGDYWRLSPTKGGYLEPTVGLERQFTEVQKGELLARVISPTTLEVIEELRSPGRGLIFYTCRSSMIRPGGWGFGIANMENDKSFWIGGESKC
jgi:predicted deacylase